MMVRDLIPVTEPMAMVGAAHLMPLVCVLSAVRTLPSEPTVCADWPDARPTGIAPFALLIARMVLPAFSGRLASWRAAQTAAPFDAQAAHEEIGHEHWVAQVIIDDVTHKAYIERADGVRTEIPQAITDQLFPRS